LTHNAYVNFIADYSGLIYNAGKVTTQIAMINTSSKHLTAVILPSILSGILTTFATALVTVFAVVSSYGKDSVLQQGLFTANDLSAPTYHQITNNLAKNVVVSNAPLFLFWSAVGLIIYLFAVNIVTAFGSGVELEEQLTYVNSQRSKLIRYEIMVVFIRVAILAGWLLYVQLFIRFVLPYALLAASTARLSSALIASSQVALAALVLFIGIHLHLVCLRLLLLKRRVFADNDDI